MKLIKSLISFTLIGFILISCGKTKEVTGTKTEVFSMENLSNAGLYMGAYTFEQDSNESFVIVCNDEAPETAERRISLLNQLKRWSSDSTKDLILDDTLHVSIGELKVAADQAIIKLSELDPKDTKCPDYWVGSILMN